MMDHMIGCWVEQMESGKWAICWPDCSYMETGFGSRGTALRTLNYYRMCKVEDANEKHRQDDLRSFESKTYPSPGDVSQ